MWKKDIRNKRQGRTRRTRIRKDDRGQPRWVGEEERRQHATDVGRKS